MFSGALSPHFRRRNLRAHQKFWLIRKLQRNLIRENITFIEQFGCPHPQKWLWTASLNIVFETKKSVPAFCTFLQMPLRGDKYSCIKLLHVTNRHNTTVQILYWISKISMKSTVDFAERYNGGRRSFELYVLPRILDFIKQKVSKTQTHVGQIFVQMISSSKSSRTKSIKNWKFKCHFQIDHIMMLWMIYTPRGGAKAFGWAAIWSQTQSGKNMSGNVP